MAFHLRFSLIYAIDADTPLILFELMPPDASLFTPLRH